jgi:imidazolonepropionase
LACVLMRMTLNEALVAATLNAAASIKRSHNVGSIEEGKYGDLILLKAPRWEHLIYELVDPPIQYVFKRGNPVYHNTDL